MLTLLPCVSRALQSSRRYGICGQPLRGLLPFVREAVGVPISTEGRVCRAVCPPPPALPPSRLLEPSAKCGSDDAGSGTGAAARDETLLKSMVEALGPEFDAKEQVNGPERPRRNMISPCPFVHRAFRAENSAGRDGCIGARHPQGRQRQSCLQYLMCRSGLVVRWCDSWCCGLTKAFIQQAPPRLTNMCDLIAFWCDESASLSS